MKIAFALFALLFCAPFARADEPRINQLDSLPDEDAQNTAKMFADQVMDNDPPGFYDMIPKDGLSYFGKKLSKDQVKKKAGDIAEFCRLGQSKDEKEAGSPWTLTVDGDPKLGKKTFRLYNGSGYGKLPVAEFSKTKDGWKLTALRVVDYGAP